MIVGHLLPDLRPILERQRFEDVGHVSGVHRADVLVQLGDVLAMLEVLQQAAVGPFLPGGQRVEQPVPLQQPLHVVQPGLQPGLRSMVAHVTDRIARA